MEKVRDVVDAISSTLGPTLFSSSEKNVMANEEDTASSTSPIYLLPSKTETEHNLKPSKKKGLKGFKKKNKNKKQNKIDKFMVTVSYLSKLEGEVKEAKEVLNEVAKFQNQVTEYDKLLEQELKKIFQFILPTEAVERSPAHNSEIAEASVVCQAQSRSSTQYQTAMEIALLKESSRSLSYHGGFSDINVVHTSSSLAKSSHEKIKGLKETSLSTNQLKSDEEDEVES